MVQQMSEPAVGPVRPEYVTPGWAERLARSVAPVRDVSSDEDDTGLPGSVPAAGRARPGPPGRREHRGPLAAGSGGGSTRAVIGTCYDGPFGVDLVRDGPHGLVAGHDRRGQVRAAADPGRVAGRAPTGPMR